MEWWLGSRGRMMSDAPKPRAKSDRGQKVIVVDLPRKLLTKTQKFDRTIVELLWPTLSKVSTTNR